MKYLSTFLTLTITSFNCFLFATGAVVSKDTYKTHMLRDLETIKHVLEVNYGPTLWKESYIQWNLEEAIAQAKHKILSSEHLTLKQFHQILTQFINTTQDYHVEVSFNSTEIAVLPFSVKSANGKYFVDWVQEETLGKNSIQVGDELITFNGMPIDQVIQDLKSEIGAEGNTQTDQSLAEIRLTLRFGKRGDTIPNNSTTVTIKSLKNKSIHSYELNWNHYPELIKSPFESNFSQFSFLDLILKSKPPKLKLKTKTSMLSPKAELYPSLARNKTSDIGAFRSFLPKLGTVVWSGEEDQIPFDTYIYRNEKGSLIGYIRIPHYRGTAADVEAFGQIIDAFQKHTDALVIDQVNNPGGLLLYQYALASTLTNHDLVTPKHRLSINQQNVTNAYQDLEILNLIDENKSIEDLFDEDDFFKTKETIQLLKVFCQFIIDEWNKGHTLTEPTFLDGVDKIKPHSQYRYTKPILLLINELDFSGGDFFPAILQDNKRARLFGTKTAGAGGCVVPFTFPNFSGIEKFYYTCSIAERPNGEKLENLGVKPDIEYQLTEEDLQYNYRSYAKAVNQAVQDLIRKGNKKK